MATKSTSSSDSATQQADTLPAYRLLPSLRHVEHAFTRNYAPAKYLPAVLRPQMIAYTAAVVLQLGVSGVQSLIKLALPTFGLAASLHLLVIVGIALLWGTGPSVMATLIGAVIFDYLDIVPHFSLMNRDAGNIASIVLFLGIGLAISYLVSRTQREREQAEERAHQVQHLNDQMQTFLSLVSHELRTPLTTIQASTQLLSRRAARLHADDEQMQVLLGKANSQVQRLGLLLNDLIDMARIRTGKIEMHMEPCDLVAIVTEEVNQAHLTYSDRVIKLAIAPHISSTVVRGDTQRLTQVLTNYLSNALKYSRREQPVTVHVSQEHHALTVTVEDHGLGIPTDELAHIWEIFHRVEGVEVQSGSGVGLGLGLHICKTFIEEQHGTVGVKSTVGQGSQFWFTIPLLEEASTNASPF